jgi:hypothetical protein
LCAGRAKALETDIEVWLRAYSDSCKAPSAICAGVGVGGADISGSTGVDMIWVRRQVLKVENELHRDLAGKHEELTREQVAGPSPPSGYSKH